jgi:cytoskeletal protein RodZ
LTGELLRKRREELGLDLREISHTLRIRHEYLKAIEDNDIKKLPPEVYTKGYVRTYGRFLGLDPEPLVEELLTQITLVRGIQPEPCSPKKTILFPKTFFLVPVLIALVIILFVAFPRTKISRPERSGVAGVPAPVAPQNENTVTGMPAPLISHNEDTTSPSTEEEKYTVRVTAKDTAWLRITMDEGKTEEVLLQPGESKEWTSQRGFDLKLGNAGGTSVTLNGKDMGILGEKGQVIRLRLPAAESRQPLSEEIR